MNVYFFYPAPIIEDRFKILLSILKVKHVINLSSRPFDISIFSDLDINYHDFSNNKKLDTKVLTDAANVILKELTIKDQGKDNNSYRIRKDVILRYSWGSGSFLNPLQFLFKAESHNYMILDRCKRWYSCDDNYRESSTEYIIRYIMNTLNKYSPTATEIVKYWTWRERPTTYDQSYYPYNNINRDKPLLQKVCFVSLPYGLIDGCRCFLYSASEKQFHVSPQVQNYRSKVSEEEHYDPLLSYVGFETKYLRNSENLSQFFYGNENYVRMLKEIITYRDEAKRKEDEEISRYASYNERSDDWGQDAEMNYILNNGGDWVLD